MYRGFNLSINSKEVDWLTDEYYDLGKSIYSRHKSRVKTGIEQFLSDDGYIDGERMEMDWFPQIKTDVFISHSHADEYKAICLAGYLEKTFSLRSFVDSCIWRNADELLRAIDNEKCLSTDKNFYYYKRRNSSTSHVHMMLSAALLKMMDNTECFIFLKSRNSITATTSDMIAETKSPWLYAEILMSSLVRKRSLAKHRPDLSKARSFSESGVLNENTYNIRHAVYTGHLTDIDESDLDAWEAEYSLSLHDKYPLDGLYNFF
jgi:hypothetical protein